MAPSCTDYRAPSCVDYRPVEGAKLRQGGGASLKPRGPITSAAMCKVLGCLAWVGVRVKGEG